MKLAVPRFAFFKTALATLTLGGFLVLASAPAAKAYDRDDCYRRVNYTEMRYRQAVEHLGPHSREARHWAHERREAYEHCRAYWR